MSLGFEIQLVATMIFVVGYIVPTGKARDLTSIENRAWPFLIGADLLLGIAYLFYFCSIIVAVAGGGGK